LNATMAMHCEMPTSWRRSYTLHHTILLHQSHVVMSWCVENGVFWPNNDLKSCLAYGCIRRAGLSMRYRKWCPPCRVIYRNATPRKHCWPRPPWADISVPSMAGTIFLMLPHTFWKIPQHLIYVSILTGAEILGFIPRLTRYYTHRFIKNSGPQYRVIQTLKFACHGQNMYISIYQTFLFN
jgi:hypothetical protein